MQAVDCERAYVVLEGVDGSAAPSVLLCCSQRSDGVERPSTTVLRRALASGRPFVSADVRRDERLLSGGSVRDLALRSVLGVRLSTPCAALVLDSRADTGLVCSERVELAEAFAAMIELCLRDTVEPAVHRPAPRTHDDWLEGRSPAWRAMVGWLERVARSSLPVHVTGETGCGKELVARELHRRSDRRGAPFVAANCAAFTETLLDAELFGAVRGAYTGAERDRAGLFRQAEGGTLLLDEVGDMPASMQAKLLRVLQEGRVRPVGGEREIAIDVRLVTATHRDLSREVSAGRFWSDLFYRLAVAELHVPPLRERAEDLPLVVERLAPRLARETGRSVPRLSDGAWQALYAHDWPGNVRELHGVLARALLRSGGESIEAPHLGLTGETGFDATDAPSDGALERRMIVAALHATEGNIACAARRIGWTRQKLCRRMRKLEVVRRSGRRP
jgi:DNA-binding NtrC family response regulator